MEEGLSIISIKTANFDAMCKFFVDMEFDVRDSEGDQLCPLFGDRGVTIWFPDVMLNLEEDTKMTPNDSFNISICGFALAKLMRLQERLGAEVEKSFYGLYYTFTTPDGGKVVLSSSD